MDDRSSDDQTARDARRQAKVEAAADLARAKAARPWYRKKRIVIPAALVALAIIGTLSGSGPSDSMTEPADDPAPLTPDNLAAPTEASTPTPRVAATPKPDGDVGGECALLLFTSGLQSSEFAATVDVENTGNIGIVVRATARFDQLGRDDYVLRDRVRVKPGRTRTVKLSETIDSTTVGRHQNGGYSCDVDGEIVDTFGEPVR